MKSNSEGHLPRTIKLITAYIVLVRPLLIYVVISLIKRTVKMKQESKEINGVTYKVTTMDALTALSVQTKLIKILGGSFGELTGGADKESIAKAISKLTDNIDDHNVVTLITKLFDKGVFYVKVADGHPIDTPIEFNTYFSGKTADMWLVALFILEVNFSDVLGKLGLNSIFQEVNQKLDS